MKEEQFLSSLWIVYQKLYHLPQQKISFSKRMDQNAPKQSRTISLDLKKATFQQHSG
jgi:hypothetical protein